jgi:hypothetical protein
MRFEIMGRHGWSNFIAIVLGVAGAGGCGTEVSGGGAGSGGAASSGAGSTATTSSTGSGGAAGAAGAGGAASTSTSASSTGAGGGGGSGYCNDESNCDGYPCLPIVPGGFRVCWMAYLDASSCTGSELDECCSNADCAMGTCQQWPAKPYCGGAAIEWHNVCAVDECFESADCGPGMACAARGTVHNKMNVCIPATCQIDADCTAEPGGVCHPLQAQCCNAVSLACVYPSNGCTNDAQCPGGYCGVTADGRAACVPGAPLCPP